MKLKTLITKCRCFTFLENSISQAVALRLVSTSVAFSGVTDKFVEVTSRSATEDIYGNVTSTRPMTLNVNSNYWSSGDKTTNIWEKD